MTTFESLNLPEPLNIALKNLKFETPTDVQAAAIPAALNGEDVIATAETGSGKTAAFLIPIINSLIEDKTQTALVLAPTRELAQQISDVAKLFVKEVKDVDVSCLVGGADIRRQLKSLQRKPRLVIATPGRLTDHLKRRSIELDKTKSLVLDEGDRMIDMGFAPQLKIILQYLPQDRQTLFFTATLPAQVNSLAKAYLKNPKRISVGAVSKPVTAIKQTVIQTTVQDKNDKLMDELNKRQGSIIIFTKTKRGTDNLTHTLLEYGFAASQIHGDRTQGQRNKAINGFKKGQFRILCATDVASRGIDVPHVEHVINYDLPMADEDYVHRIGRTARNGSDGEAVTFVLPKDHYAWKKIARKYNIMNVELKPVQGASDSPEDPMRRKNSKKKFGKKPGTGFNARFKTKSGPSGGGNSKFGGKKKKKFSSSRARA